MGRKLWREHSTGDPKLLCANCASIDQGKNIGSMDDDGKRLIEHGQRTDQIGWYMPAVPCDNMPGFWAYTMVPDAGVAWWQNLPNW